jgi:hypothetical protein
MVMVLPVKDGQYHILFVAGKNRFYLVNFGLEFFLQIPLVFLPPFGHRVEGQAENADSGAYAENRYSRIFKYLLRKGKHKFDYLG